MFYSVQIKTNILIYKYMSLYLNDWRSDFFKHEDQNQSWTDENIQANRDVQTTPSFI